MHPDRQHDPAIWKGLVETARLADPDPWRSELRELTVREDLIGLRKLADSSDIAALPVQSLQHMGNALDFRRRRAPPVSLGCATRTDNIPATS